MLSSNCSATLLDSRSPLRRTFSGASVCFALWFAGLLSLLVAGLLLSLLWVVVWLNWTVKGMLLFSKHEARVAR